ncbi:MAG TPA: PspC domain-containing protein [Candidatus Paceibacterota bacterium]|nr:PspC domain-containing protein [Candidatus Paceibacterota bacterium]
MEKKLTRSRTNRMIAGVMGGLGEFFAVDAVLLRLGYLILTVFTGFIPGIIGYVLAVLIVPEAPRVAPSVPVADDTEAV